MIVALDHQRLAFKFRLSAWRRSAKVAPFFTGMGILQTMFIGFDYGTANCSVAVMRENTPAVDTGKRQRPAALDALRANARSGQRVALSPS